jgi:broad specificity phosphatase PhoE
VRTPEDEVVLVRHGETEWSRTGRHTGRTEIPLSEQGRREAKAIGAALRERRFALVLSSPLERAGETCRLAGFGAAARQAPGLAEWDYGAYEGLTSAEIRTASPGWTLWREGVPDGETLAQVGARADSVIAELQGLRGSAVLFSHGHFLRVLAARWLGLPPAAGRLFALDAGSISALGLEHETATIRRWNLLPPPAAF